MEMSLKVNLDGLHDKFTLTGRKCAVCGKDWDADDQDDIPLMLWKEDGSMLTLCMDPCAQDRFYDDGVTEVSE